MSNDDDEDEEEEGGLAAFLLGLIGGAIAAYVVIKIIEGLTTYRCPDCGGSVRIRSPQCPHCGVSIRWGSAR